jgi:hypothetical protein
MVMGGRRGLLAEALRQLFCPTRTLSLARETLFDVRHGPALVTLSP